MTNKTTLKRLKLDPYFSKTIDTNLNVWSHDQNSYEIKFEFYDHQCDKPIDLTGADMRILLDHADSKPKIYPLEVESKVLGLAKFVMPEQIRGCEGKFTAHIYADYPNKTHDFGSFTFYTKLSRLDGDLGDCMDEIYVSEFEKALEDIKGFKVDIDKNINGMKEHFDDRYNKAKDDIDNIERLINNNDVAKKTELGNLDSFREFEPDVITKMKNEFVERAINVVWFGAKGDKKNDNTESFRRAIENTPEGGTVFLPEGDYLITDNITINKNINVFFKGDIYFKGEIDKPVFDIVNIKNSSIYIKKIYNTNQSTPLWELENFSAVKLDGLFSCDVYIGSVFNFTNALEIFSSHDGFWFNKIKTGQFLNCKNGTLLHTANEGWINANEFSNLNLGFSGKSFIDNTYDKTTINQKLTNNSYGGNTNVFTNARFETNISSPENWVQIRLKLAYGWLFDHTRIEMKNTDVLAEIEVFDETKHSLNNELRFLPLITSDGKIPRIVYVSPEKSSTSLQNIFKTTSDDAFYYELEYNQLNNSAYKLNNNYVGVRGFQFYKNGDYSYEDYYAKDEFINTNNGLSIKYKQLVLKLSADKNQTFNIKTFGGSRAKFILLDKDGKEVKDAKNQNTNKVASNCHYINGMYSYLTDQKEYSATVLNEEIKEIHFLFWGTLNKLKITSDKELKLLDNSSKMKTNITNLSFVDGNNIRAGEVFYNDTARKKYVLSSETLNFNTFEYN